MFLTFGFRPAAEGRRTCPLHGVRRPLYRPIPGALLAQLSVLYINGSIMFDSNRAVNDGGETNYPRQCIALVVSA